MKSLRKYLFWTSLLASPQLSAQDLVNRYSFQNIETLWKGAVPGPVSIEFFSGLTPEKFNGVPLPRIALTPAAEHELRRRTALLEMFQNRSERIQYSDPQQFLMQTTREHITTIELFLAYTALHLAEKDQARKCDDLPTLDQLGNKIKAIKNNVAIKNELLSWKAHLEKGLTIAGSYPHTMAREACKATAMASGKRDQERRVQDKIHEKLVQDVPRKLTEQQTLLQDSIDNLDRHKQRVQNKVDIDRVLKARQTVANLQSTLQLVREDSFGLAKARNGRQPLIDQLRALDLNNIKADGASASADLKAMKAVKASLQEYEKAVRAMLAHLNEVAQLKIGLDAATTEACQTLESRYSNIRTGETYTQFSQQFGACLTGLGTAYGNLLKKDMGSLETQFAMHLQQLSDLVHEKVQ